jgi:serine/threonine-protein kinase SRPK3
LLKATQRYAISPFFSPSCRMESSGNSQTSQSKSCLPVYDVIDDVERLGGYCPGGYHPITIKDYLHDRYHIVHKLGFGTYSTVWLAWDERAGRYVSIKIGIAVMADDSQESSIIRSLVGVKENPLNDLILPTLDEFFLTGPNGKHRCFVTVPARMNLTEAQDEEDYISTARSPCHRRSTHPNSIFFALSRNCSRW